MLTLVIGGAASGKSSYAERLAVAAGPAPIYLATLQVAEDAENRERIQKHRHARAGLGFETVERGLALADLPLLPNRPVLLECLTTLLANELYSPGGAGEAMAEERIMAGIRHLAAQGRTLVVVSGSVFSDGITYDPATEGYRRILGSLHRQIAAQAHRVVEVVCGIPILLKGEEPDEKPC